MTDSEAGSDLGRSATPSFSKLHLMTWRTMAPSLSLYVCLPLAVWFAADVTTVKLMALTEGAAPANARWSGLFEDLISVTAGSLAAAIAFAALGESLQGRVPSPRAVLAKAWNTWACLFGVWFAAGWRIALASLLLVLPGIYLALRYCLALPAAAIDGKRRHDALEASAALMKGRYWRILAFVVGGTLLYLPIAVVPELMLPAGAGDIALALALAPANLLISLVFVAMGVLYHALHVRQEPVVDLADVPATTSAAGRSVAAACAVSLLFLAVGLGSGQAVGQTLVKLGDQAYSTADYETAIDRYESAVEWMPDDAYLQFSLGCALVELDRFDEAASHLAAAVEIEPDSASYRVVWAGALMGLADNDRAWEVLQAAMPLAPENPSLHNMLGWAHLARGDTEEAERSLAAACDLAPDDADYLLDHAQVLLLRGDIEAASLRLEQAAIMPGVDHVTLEALRADLLVEQATSQKVTGKG